MNYLHQKLTTKYRLYHNWHQHRHHNKVHWGVFVAYSLFVFSLILNPLSFTLNSESVDQLPSQIEIITKNAKAVSDINVPLIIQEALPQGVIGINRESEPVTIGIPLAENSGIKNINQLSLLGANAGQFRALAFWPNGNIKWVLIDFQADVSAGGQNTNISLINGIGGFGGSNLATDNGTTITINTGVSQFVIKKSNFNVIDQAIVNGQTLVSAGNNGRILMRDQNDIEYASSNDSLSTAKIEENGPVKTVIKVTGSFKNSQGNRLMDYTLRMYFYKNKSYVKSNITLRNASKEFPSHVLFNSAEIILPMNFSNSTKTVEFAKNSDTVTGNLSNTETASLYQGFSIDKMQYTNDVCGSGSYGWDPPSPGVCQNSKYIFDSSQSGLAIKTGVTELNVLGNKNEWTQGYARFSDESQKGITMAMRWMSAYWPAGFEFKGNGETSIEIFSKKNTKKNLKFAFGAHETREIIWNFENQTSNSKMTLYNLQYPLVARASLDYYKSSKAIFNQEEFVTPEQQNQFFADLGKVSPSLANPPMNRVFRFWGWRAGGGDNQTDFPLNDLQDFLRTGNSGFYLLGEQRTLFNSDGAVSHSDDFAFETNFTISDPVPAQNTVNGDSFDMEHAHMLSLPFYYYLTGNEQIKETVLDYGEYLDRSQITNYFSLPSTAYFRAWTRKYRNLALVYEFGCYVGACDTRLKNYIEETTNYLLDSRDNPSQGIQSPRGRNLDRGYVYWDSTLVSGFGYRPIHGLFHPQMHFEAVWQVLRIMKDTGWNYSRKEDIEDYLLGLSQFYFNEMYVDFNGGDAVNEFGFHYDYPIDNGYTPTTNTTIPYDASRAAVFGYQKTGDSTFLNKANKLVWAITDYATGRSPSELQDQSLMYAHFNLPKIWQSIPVSFESNGSGLYNLLWTVPQGATQYQIKYSDKPIIDWLGFDRVTRNYQYDPDQHTAFFAANNISNEPIPLSPGQVQTFSISNLFCGSACFFSIKYTSNDLVIKPPTDTISPTIPTSLTASAVSSSQINLNWQASTDNIGVVNYNIYRCQGNCIPTTKIASSNTNSYQNTGLSANTVYTYIVSAVDGAGNEGGKSTSVNEITKGTISNNPYENIADNTWVLMDEGTYADRSAGRDPTTGILAFSGMAIDTINQQILVFGGGHNDYFGNEVWAWDINTRSWKKMHEPDPLNTVTLEECLNSVDNQNFPGMWLSSGRPISRHTYNAVEFITHKGLMITGGASSYSGPNSKGVEFWNDVGVPGGCYPNGPKDTWTYDFTTNKWQYRGSAYNDQSRGFGSLFVYDPNTKLVFAPRSNGVWAYDIDTDSWNLRSAVLPATSMYEAGITFDTKRRRLLMFGGGGLWSYDVSNNKWTQITPQGTGPATGEGWGMVYDSANDVVILLKDALFVYDPTINQWSQIEMSNPAPGNLGVYNYIHGNFQYDPIHNVVFFVNKTQDFRVDVWVYRYRKSSIGTDTILPTVPYNISVTPFFPSQINLSWTASTDNVAVTGYRVERCQGSTCTNFTQIATPTGTSYNDTGLAANTTYRYRVRAIDGAGNLSDYSSIVNATTSPQTFNPSDLNRDNQVNQTDLDILKQDWNKTTKPKSDINQDGIVDSKDLGILMSNWTG